MRLIVLIVTLAACGPPSPEDLARTGLERSRAAAVQKSAGPCVAACDRAIAELDRGVRVEHADSIPAARAVCAAAGIN